MDLKDSNKPETEIKTDDNNKKKFDWNKVKESRFVLFIKRNLKKIIIIIILIFAAITAFQVNSAVQSSKTVQSGTSQNFEEVTARDISNAISVTGTIASSETRTLSTLVSNTEVTDVFVEVGDYVKVGDPICTFDTSTIESNIRKVEREITVNNAKATLELAKANTQVAWAMEDYVYNQSMGQYDLNSAMNNYLEQQNQVADSIDNLNEKERELDSLKDEYHDYKKAKRNDTVSEGSYKKSSSEYKDAIASAEEAVSAAGRAVENSGRNLQLSIDNYNKAVETLEHQGVTDLRTISSNMASVIETQLNNLTTNDEAEEKIRDYEKSLDNCQITAPISGIVTSVSVVEGDEYEEKSTICVIQDDSTYKVKGTVDQYDVAKITESMNCVIKTDATGDDQMTGMLTFVSPVPESSASSTSGTSGSSGSSSDSTSAEYPVEITIEGRDDRLRIGMSAEASVLIESKKNVKAVPYDTIEEDDDGSFYVNVEADASELPEINAEEIGAGLPEGADLPAPGDEDFDPESFGNGKGPGAFSGKTKKTSYSGNPIANFIAERMIGKSASELYAEAKETPTKKVKVEKGLENDYYTEVISDELEVGDKVLVPESESSESDFGFGVGFGGPGGPRGGF